MLKATNRKLTGSEKRQIKAVIRRARSGHGNRVSAQQTIPYQRMYPDGVCRVDVNRYNKTIQFQDINYQLSENEDKDAIFGAGASSSTTLTARFPSSFRFSIWKTDRAEEMTALRGPRGRMILTASARNMRRCSKTSSRGAITVCTRRNT